MKAIVYAKYGPPEALQLMEVEKPVPQDDQVLIKVQAASVNALDWRRFTMTPLLVRLASGGLLEPKKLTLGADVAGRVEVVGQNVQQFKPGDEVFGVCRGSFADYVCATENQIALKPTNLSFEEAAAIPVAAITALQGLRDVGHIQPGQKVLIYGASGGVGTFAVQLAKCFGAEVTAICSTRNLSMVRSIGADQVIDYTKEDFRSRGQRYDLVVVVNGALPTLNYKRVLNPIGLYVVLGGSLVQVIEAMLLGKLASGTQKISFMLSHKNQDDLAYLAEMLEDRKIVPIIDRCYPLSEAAQAVKCVVEQHPQGKVVIGV